MNNNEKYINSVYERKDSFLRVLGKCTLMFLAAALFFSLLYIAFAAISALIN